MGTERSEPMADGDERWDCCRAGTFRVRPCVLGFCRERLADYKRPKQVHVTQGIPKNAYGKVLKRDLRATYAGPSDR